MKFYDPPSGWQYGFPKPFNPRPGESIRDTLIRDGYPPELADKVMDCKKTLKQGWPVRFWDDNSSVAQFASGLQLDDEDNSEFPYKNNHGN